ncbi:MAG: ABC transporter permease [Anaerolineae bacterium]|nr:ABC transporter permease [Anaerolineae bacterium]
MISNQQAQPATSNQELATSNQHHTSNGYAESITIIRPSKGWLSLRLREVWEYRELLYFLVWRDVKVRYKQSVLGATWAILQPVMTIVVFSVIFGNLARIPSDGIPYPVFAFTALLPWNYFSSSLNRSSTSLVGSANLLTKVYFPRLVIPLTGVLAPLVDFAIAFVVLIGLLFYYQVPLTIAVVWLPLFILLAGITALSAGLWLSALNVKYRDVGHLVPFLIQIWMYATPIVYPSSLVPERWRLLYGLNPMAGVVEGFRWSLLGKGVTSGPMLLASVGVVILMLIGGLFYFRRMEKTFADVV